MNLLTTIPPRVRQALYLGYALVGVSFGAIQVGLQSADAGFPVWLKVALSVYAFLGTALGLTAASNTPDLKHRADDRGLTSVGLVLLVVLVVVLVLLLAGQL